MENDSSGFAWLLVIILAIWVYNLRSDIKELNSDLSYAEDRLDSANYQIREAQGYAGTSYIEMSSALDNLITQ